MGLKTDPTEQRDAQAGAEAPVAGEGLRRDDPAPEAAGVFKQPWLVVACLLLAASCWLPAHAWKRSGAKVTRARRIF